MEIRRLVSTKLRKIKAGMMERGRKGISKGRLAYPALFALALSGGIALYTLAPPEVKAEPVRMAAKAVAHRGRKIVTFKVSQGISKGILGQTLLPAVRKGRFGRPFLPGEGGKRWYVPRNLLPPPSMWQYIRYPTLPRWYGRRTGKPDSPLKYLFSGTPEIVLNPELKRAFPHAIALLRQLQGEEAFGLLPATNHLVRLGILDAGEFDRAAKAAESLRPLLGPGFPLDGTSVSLSRYVLAAPIWVAERWADQQ